MKKLELQMYGLVPYNISPIQQGIQFGHAKDEYTLEMLEILDEKEKYDPESIKLTHKYRDWLKNWKTYIILNGGTTNNNPETPGTLNQHLQTLKDKGIFCASFHEPDLGDQLTGVVFIVDERVFLKDENKKYVYLDFEDWIWENPSPYINTSNRNDRWFTKTIRRNCKESSDQNLTEYYNTWVKYMGGEKNVFLRDFLKNFRLA